LQDLFLVTVSILFFQAEDGIRDRNVTGVQTCALPISEGTAPVVRSFVEHKMHGNPSQPVKLYYFAQMFRYERPQKGRMRQLNQFGVEVMGSADPAVDAEVIDLAMTCYRELGLKSLKLVITSLGDKERRESH